MGWTSPPSGSAVNRMPTRIDEPVLSRVTDVTTALAEAQDRGAVAHLVGPVRSRTEALDAFAAALEFPSWLGHDLDALLDCLTDLSWQAEGEHILIWSGHGELADADPVTYRAVLSILEEAVAAPHGRPLTVVLADG